MGVGAPGPWVHLTQIRWVTLSPGFPVSASPSSFAQWDLVEMFKGRGQRCLAFGDFDFQKIFALTPASTLPCLSFPGKFPLRPGTQP